MTGRDARTDRRRFLKAAALAAGGAALGCRPPTPGRAGTRLRNWVWVTTELELSDDEWRQRFALWRAHGLDAILLEVFNSSEAYYASTHLPVKEERLERILPLGLEAGLEVHAWIHTMNCNLHSVHAAHPEWFSVNRRGQSSWEYPAYIDSYRFLCPSRVAVHEFLRQRVRELAAIEQLSGIHLDVIRYPDVILPEGLQPRFGIIQDREEPQYDYCYCEVCRAQFERARGVDPLALEDPAANRAWLQFRYDRITRIVNQVLAPLARAGDKAMTAAVFANWQHVRQQWSRWRLDGVLPMFYHSLYLQDLAWIGEQTRAGIAARDRDVPVYAGLLVEDTPPRDLGRAVRIALDAGASGVALYSARSMAAAHWRILESTGAFQ